MKIIVIDDDFFITTALKTLLEAGGEIRVVASGTDGKEALSLYKHHKPDVILMDIRMKEMSGLTAAKEILSYDKDAKVLLLTTFSDDEYIVKALKLGAKGYLLKQDYNCIAPAIKAVLSGQTVFGNEITARIPDLLSNSSNFDYAAYGINGREYEVIELVAEGFSNKEISEQLFLSEGTVRNYLSSILEKLALRDRTQLAVFFYQH